MHDNAPEARQGRHGPVEASGCPRGIGYSPAVGAARVFVIAGQLAAGKSTVARAVLDRFDFGFLVDVDAVREMVTSGLASPLEWTAETTRQFDLALRASVTLAGVYHDAGFAVAIEGGIDPGAIARMLREAGLQDQLVGVVLHPPLEVALDRNRQRLTKAFETSILEGAMRQIDADLASEPLPHGWLRLDNGAESIEITVERVLSASAGR